MLDLGGIDPEKKVNQYRERRTETVCSFDQAFSYDAYRLRDYPEAIITKGGVNVKEIDPGTMESKLVKGLYFCGRSTGSGCIDRRL